MHENAGTNSSVRRSAALPDDQLAYSVPHAAEVLDLSDRTMWDLVRSGTIESIKIGRSRRILRVSLLAYVERLRGAA